MMWTGKRSKNLPLDKHLQTKQPFWKVGHGHMGSKAGQLYRKACLLELIVEASEEKAMSYDT